MRRLWIDPRRLVPYHRPDPERIRPYPEDPAERLRVPPIPVFEIPEWLRTYGNTPMRELGDYLLYNGHHRRHAALMAGVERVEIAVLDSDEDLLLNDGSELLSVRGRSRDIAQHQGMVYQRARLRSADLIREERHMLLERAASSTGEPP